MATTSTTTYNISIRFNILNYSIFIIIITTLAGALKDADLKDGKIQETPLNVESFVILRKSVSQSEAMVLCETRKGGGRLAVLLDKDIAAKVSAAIMKASTPWTKLDDKAQLTAELGVSRRYWIGLADMMSEGDWIWLKDGSPLQYDFWYPGQPDHGVKTPPQPEHCVVFWNPIYYEKGGSHSFNDENCANKHYFICENLPPPSKGRSFYGDIEIDSEQKNTTLPFGVTLLSEDKKNELTDRSWYHPVGKNHSHHGNDTTTTDTDSAKQNHILLDIGDMVRSYDHDEEAVTKLRLEYMMNNSRKHGNATSP